VAQSPSDRRADTEDMNDASPGSVLLVEADSPERRRLGEALEAAGFDVLACQGPTKPDDDCVGIRTGLCPLLTDVDVVVLDVQLEAIDAEFRTTSEELLNLYLGGGRPVVALGLRGRRLDEEGLLRLKRSPDADELIRGVRRLVGDERNDA
jgi:CheY-like chemotaxis protein